MARLEQAGGRPDDDDWWAMLSHVTAAAPGTRLGERLVDRLSVLPMSHHHRFPIYEQVCSRGQISPSAASHWDIAILERSRESSICLSTSIYLDFLTHATVPQVSGLPEHHDRVMHEAGLRVPPRFARDAESAEALLLGEKLSRSRSDACYI